MNEKKEYLRSPIDFRPARGYVGADIIYTVLMQHNGTKHTNHSASKLIVDAYKSYDASETPDLTELKNSKTKAIAFVEKYGIRSLPDAVKAVKKLNSYQKNGILPGERLILTFETEQDVLNTSIVKQLVDRYLK